MSSRSCHPARVASRAVVSLLLAIGCARDPAPLDGGRDAGSEVHDAPIDAQATDAREHDADGSSACRTACGSVECGSVEDGCGGVLACRPCDPACDLAWAPRDSTGTILFEDHFESGLDAWTVAATLPDRAAVTSAAQAEHVYQVTASTSRTSRPGDAGLALDLTTGSPGAVEVVHALPERGELTLRLWFREDPSASQGFALGLTEHADGTGSHVLVGVRTADAALAGTYFLRHDGRIASTGVPRSPGFHQLDLVVTPSGTSALLDGRLVSMLEGGTRVTRNAALTRVGGIRLVATWGAQTHVEIDDVEVHAHASGGAPAAVDALAEMIRLYGATTFSTPFLDDANTHPRRTVAVLAETLAMAGRMGHPTGTARAVELLARVTDDPARFNPYLDSGTLEWDFAVPDARLVRAARAAWEGMDEALRERVLAIVARDADANLTRELRFYRDDPGYGTAAEENAWDAAFLVGAARLLPHDVRAQAWEARGLCFAYHAITRDVDPSACGHDPTGTVFDDFRLENHGATNPVYALATISLLLEGASAYHTRGEAIPPELLHNVDGLWGWVATRWDDSFHYPSPTSPTGYFQDWSGTVDTFLHWPTVRRHAALATLTPAPPSAAVFDGARAAFFPRTLAEHVPEPVPSIEAYSGLGRRSDGYLFFVNGSDVEQYAQQIGWEHPGCAGPSQLFLPQYDSGLAVTWHPVARAGGPLFASSVGPGDEITLRIASRLGAEAELISSLIAVTPGEALTVTYALEGDGTASACLVVDGYRADAAETHPFDGDRVATLGGEAECVPGAPGTRSVSLTIPEGVASIRLVARLGARGVSGVGDARFSAIRLER
jgi:hypothetical protein